MRISKPHLDPDQAVEAIEKDAEEDDFEDDEFDLSQPVAELAEAVGIAALHKTLLPG